MNEPNIDPTCWADQDEDPPLRSYRAALACLSASGLAVAALLWWLL